MGLTAIKNNSNWGASAADLNNNFASITAELEKLKAANIKFKGYFTSEDSLKAAYPSPGIGDNAWVGDTYPGVVYQCESYGVWTNTGLIPSAPSVELVDYAKKEMLTEYNVSVQHPSSGIGGSNQYTFATAVALVPSTLRNVGLKCLFLNSGGKIETWEYQGGTFTAAGSWLQIGSGKFAELKKDIADVSAGAVMQATDEILGGIKASPKTDNESAEVKIDPQTGKLYAPQGGGGAQITVDDALSGTSTNPVQNKIVKAEFDKKALKSDVQSLAGSISENTQDISELQSTVGTLRTETSSAKTSAQQAQRDAAAAKGAVAALEGLSNTSTAQKELAAQLTQIAENTLGVLQIRQNKYSESLYLHKEITPLKVIEGAIINTSGTLTVSTNYKGIFDVAVYSLAGVANLLLSGQMEGTLMEYVISSTSESITSVKNGPVYNGSTGLISFFSQIPVPNNGKYIFVSQHNSYRRTRLFDLGREVGSLVGTDYASARSSRMKPFETHAGYFISNSKSGTNYSIVASAAYNIKVYDVTNVKRVHIRGEASKSCSVYCFASSKAFNISSSVGNIIGNSRQVNSGNDYIDEVVEVPSNAKVLYVTEHLGTPADPILTKYAINVYSEEEQEKLITSLPVVTIFNHYILSTAAGLVANGGPYRVVLYDVTGRDKIRLYGEGNGGIAHYVFTAIDSLSNPIQIGRTASSADGIIRFDEEVVVPSGAKRLWITQNINSACPLKAGSHRKSSNESAINALFEDKKCIFNSDIVLVPVYGQSLAIGGDASPAVTSYGNLRHREYVITSENLTTQTDGAETSKFGLCESFLDEYCRRHLLSVVDLRTNIASFASGTGSTSINGLKKGTANYTTLINKITTAFNLAKNMGKRLTIPAFCWIQGEEDRRDSSIDYKALLSQLRVDLSNDIKAITGQISDVHCIVYQTNQIALPMGAPDFDPLSFNDIAKTRMVPAQAQYELIRDNPYFHASSPIYPMKFVVSSNGQMIHITAASQKLLGYYEGIAVNNILDAATNGKSTGLIISSVTKVDTTHLRVYFKIPVPPLVIDTDLVKEVSNYGFTVINSSNENIISSVELVNNSVWDAYVEITTIKDCSGAKLRYGVIGENGKSGWELGPRGNLRDSQGYDRKAYINGSQFPLHNWCYMCELLIK